MEDKSNPTYTNPNLEDDSSKERKVKTQSAGPFHENPSEKSEVQRRNEGDMEVDDKAQNEPPKRLEDKPGAYLLKEIALDEEDEEGISEDIISEEEETIDEEESDDPTKDDMFSDDELNLNPPVGRGDDYDDN